MNYLIFSAYSTTIAFAAGFVCGYIYQEVHCQWHNEQEKRPALLGSPARVTKLIDRKLGRQAEVQYEGQRCLGPRHRPRCLGADRPIFAQTAKAYGVTIRGAGRRHLYDT